MEQNRKEEIVESEEEKSPIPGIVESIQRRLTNLEDKFELEKVIGTDVVRLSEANVEIKNEFIKFSDKVKNLKTNQTEYKYQEATLMVKISEILADLYKNIDKSYMVFRTFRSQKPANMIAKEVRDVLTTDLASVWEDLHKQPNEYTTTTLLETLYTYTRYIQGVLNEQLRPVSGLAILNCFVRESDMTTGQIQEMNFFTGKLEPQVTTDVGVFDYLTGMFTAGVLEVVRKVGPTPTLTSSLGAWKISEATKTVKEGAEKASFIPTDAEILNSLKEARRTSEKGIAHIFSNPIPREQIKDVYFYDKQETRGYAFWNENYENSYNKLRGFYTIDPFEKVYIVVPSESVNISTDSQNQWKIGFYSLEQAKDFIEVAKKHPYWYDEKKGWNLSGWSEKMQERDRAVSALEKIMLSYLNPSVNVDLGAYLQNPEMMKDLPISEELEMLNKLIQKLQNERPKEESSESIQQVLDDIDDTVKAIQQKVREKEIPHDGYGLSEMLDSTSDNLRASLEGRLFEMRISPIK